MEYRGSDRQHLRPRENGTAPIIRQPGQTESLSRQMPGETIISRRHSGAAALASPPSTVSPGQEAMHGSIINRFQDQEEGSLVSRCFDSSPGLSRSVSIEAVSTSRATPQLTRHLSTEGRLRQKIARPYNPKPVALTPSSSTCSTNVLENVQLPDELNRQVSVGSAGQPPSLTRRVTSGQSSNSSNSDGVSAIPETTLQATPSQQLRASFTAPLGVEETEAILDRLRKLKRPSLTGSKTSEPLSTKVQDVAPLSNNYSEDTKMSEDELLVLEMTNATLNIPPASPPRGTLLRSTNSGSTNFRQKELLHEDDFRSLQLGLESEMVAKTEWKKEGDSINLQVSPISQPTKAHAPAQLEALSDEELARRLAEGLIEDIPVEDVQITRRSLPELDPSISIVPDTSTAEQLRIWQQIQDEQERQQLERALEESRRAVVGGSVDFVLSADPSTSYRHTGGEEMDILLSQQMALNEWAQRQQALPPPRSASCAPGHNALLSPPRSDVPPSHHVSELLATSGRAITTESSSHDDLRDREDILRRGQLETQQAISVGQAHIVICQGCNGRLHAPLSYSLVFCPNCHTISPGLPAQRNPNDQI